MSDDPDQKNNDQEDGEQKLLEKEEDKLPPEEDIIYKPDPNEEKKKIQQIIVKGLSQLEKTFDNTGYAYVNLKLEDKGLTTIYDILYSYPNLRYISIANNKLSDVQAFNSIPYLLVLNLSKNNIPNMNAFCGDNTSLNFLELLDLSDNKITKLEHFNLPRLKNLYLNNNQIETCENFKGHMTLKILELKKNRIKSCKGLINMPNLSDLFLNENTISAFKELYNLPSLKNLDLKQNKVESIQKPIPKLSYLYHLDLSMNIIPNLKQIIRLKDLSNLKSLIISGNPVADELGDAIKKECIMILPQLLKINEDDVTPEEKADAMNELKERIIQEEEKRKEEEERLKAEEEERLKVEEEERKKGEEEGEKPGPGNEPEAEEDGQQNHYKK